MPEALTPKPVAPAPAGAPANGTKRRRVLWVALLVGLLAAGAGAAYRMHTLQFETTDDAFVEGHVVFISSQVAGQVVSVDVEDNQLVQAGDLLVRIDQRDYQARLEQASGALAVAKAQAQAAEATLELTKVTAPAEVQAAQAGLDAATAATASARTQLVIARSEEVRAKALVDSALARTAAAEAEAEAAQSEATRSAADAARYRELVSTESATQQQLDTAASAATAAAARTTAAQKKTLACRAEVEQAQAGVATAAAAVPGAQARLEEKQAGVVEASARLAQAQTAERRIAVAAGLAAAAASAVTQAEAGERAAQLQVEHTEIRAPREGYVTRRTVQVGSYMQPGQALLAVVGTDPWVVANFKETQLRRMKAGQSAVVAVDACGGREFAAHVDSIQAGAGARFSLLPAENATGNYVKVVQRIPVKICFDEPVPAGMVAPGMSVVPRVKVR